ncbi:MAG TPA: hypothetical protein VGD67_05600 [Pseudonocardiaceae bacterium]
MRMGRMVVAMVAVLAVAGLTACGSGESVAGRATAEDDARGIEPAAAPAGNPGGPGGAAVEAIAALVATELPGLGGVVTDDNGMTLYRFDKDTARPSKSNCEGECARAWPPVLVEQGEEITANGIDRALIGTVTRADNTIQVTIAGWPVYRYIRDTRPGDVNGQGAGGSWFAATPEGKKATGGENQDQVALVVMQIAPLGEVVTDRQGMTLYRFDKDTAEPSKSNCEGDCAATWPPVLAGSADVRVEGVDPALVGTTTRADGSRQVTIGGWPVYRFAKDTVPCDIKGHGVGGTWFAVTPQGKKAGA